MPLSPLFESKALLERVVRPRADLEATLSPIAWDLPKPLLSFLRGLAVLDGVPFQYLVPDPAMLPPESLRFFHVDRSWLRALVEGALSASNVGTSDEDERFESFRDAVLREVGLSPADTTPITGMLLRSAIVRYFPGLQVRATANGAPLTALRFERLSRNILIVLWSGHPTRVEIAEPRTAAWFGVDEPRPGNTWALKKKNRGGTGVNEAFEVHRRAGAGAALGVLDIADLSKKIGGFKSSETYGDGVGTATCTSSDLALQLQQTPYLQPFTGFQDAMNDTPAGGSGVIQSNPDLLVSNLQAEIRNFVQRFQGG
jgi:hypothetical protein